VDRELASEQARRSAESSCANPAPKSSRYFRDLVARQMQNARRRDRSVCELESHSLNTSANSFEQFK
jgi:hypothetical protein